MRRHRAELDTCPRATWALGAVALALLVMSAGAGQPRFPLDGINSRGTLEAGILSHGHWLQGLPPDFGYTPGRVHAAIDIGAEEGDPVYSVLDGECIVARMDVGGMGWDSAEGAPSSGGAIIIHSVESGRFILYGHTKDHRIRQGERDVKAGDPIASVGPYGEHPHLHLSVRSRAFPQLGWGTPTLRGYPLASGAEEVGSAEDVAALGYLDPVEFLASVVHPASATPPIAPQSGEQHRLGDTKAGPDGGTYVWVPPGEFMMGTPEGAKDGYGNERPQHKVGITKGFWLSKHEVTNAQYARFCKATGRTFPKDSNQDDDHPVVWVTWEDAVAYCGHYGLRLPTEAEWEYAARGSNGNRFPWGDGWDPKKCCNGWNRGATDWGRKPGTFPVGSIPTGDSWCCVADMAGNVWEWCADRYKCDYYAESPDSDPTGPGTGDTLVLRGGAWASILADLCRSALRLDDRPQHKLNNLGFRPAMDP